MKHLHGTTLDFYTEKFLHEDTLPSHGLAYQTYFPDLRLFLLIEQKNELYGIVRWKALSVLEQTTEAHARVYKDVPRLLLQRVRQKCTSATLRAEVYVELVLEETECNNSQHNCTARLNFT